MSGRLFRWVPKQYFIGSALVFALGLSTAAYVSLKQRDISARLDRNLASTRASQRVAIDIREVRSWINRYGRSRNRAMLDEIPPLRKNIEESLRVARDLADDPKETQLVGRIEEEYRRVSMESDKLRDLRDPKEIDALVAELRETLLSSVMMPLVDEYLELNEQLVLETAEHNRSFTNLMIGGLILLGTCGAVSGLLVGYGISRQLQQTVVQLNVPIRDAAGKLGEVVEPFQIAVGGSFGEMEDTLHSMAGSVRIVVERLQRSQRETLRAEQLAAVGQMAAGFAHELRNPLTSMKILVQSASERAGLGLRDLEVLEEEIIRLENLISTFLDFARPPQAVKRHLDLRQVVQHWQDLMTLRASRVGVKLDVRTSDDPLPIVADAAQLRQLLLNLFVNALDVSNHGDVIEIECQCDHSVSTDAADCVGGEALLTVSDRGCGLPLELGDRIFDPFVSTKETGIGIGLSICKRIVEDHGGKIAAQPRDGGGAVLSVRLPLSVASAMPAPNPA